MHVCTNILKSFSTKSQHALQFSPALREVLGAPGAAKKLPRLTYLTPRFNSLKELDHQRVFQHVARKSWQRDAKSLFLTWKPIKASALEVVMNRFQPTNLTIIFAACASSRVRVNDNNTQCTRSQCTRARQFSSKQERATLGPKGGAGGRGPDS